jgi:hypothetical protein
MARGVALAGLRNQSGKTVLPDEPGQGFRIAFGKRRGRVHGTNSFFINRLQRASHEVSGEPITAYFVRGSISFNVRFTEILGPVWVRI